MTVLGILVIIGSVIGAIALWLFLLITGIVGVADNLTQDPIVGSDLGWNIVKIILAEIAGVAVGLVGFLVGMAIIALDD